MAIVSDASRERGCVHVCVYAWEKGGETSHDAVFTEMMTKYEVTTGWWIIKKERSEKNDNTLSV